MIDQLRLSDLIHDRIPLKPISTGWEVCRCPLCNDYKDRGGFKFEDNNIVYSCFNCSKKTVYEEFGGKISRNFRQVLNAFGIEDEDINRVVNSVMFSKKEENKTITLEKLTKVSTATPTIQLPSKTFQLGHHPEFLDYQEKLVKYLDDRKVDLNKYDFFFSLEPKLVNRVIIPYYRNGHLIYWQARSIDDTEKKRYDNASAPRTTIMFNIDQLMSYSNLPLFVCEGVFDAMMVDGVALLGSTINASKAELLSKSKRRLVFVIDKDNNGKVLAEDVLERGWEITFSPEGSADLNESVRRFGNSWTNYELVKGIPPNKDIAIQKINLFCR